MIHLRIALLTSSYLPVVGGLEWKVHYLASEYTAMGHDVEIFAPRPAFGYRKAVVPAPMGFRVHRFGYPARGAGRLGITRLLMRRAVLRSHRRRPFDVFHCHPVGLPSQVGVEVARGTDAIVVATTTGGDVTHQTERGVAPKLPSRALQQARAGAEGVDAIVAVSRAMRRAVQDLDVKVAVVDIPNGVAWQDFQGGRSDWLQKTLKIPEDQLIVLSVGRNAEMKNYRGAMAAFSRALRHVPAAHYVIVGRDVPRLAETDEAKRLGDALHLVDQQPMSLLPSIFHSADIFFNPSLAEGFSQSNAQALASGLPLVITDAPGNVDAGDNGGALVAVAGDVEDMAAKLATLMESRDRRDALGRESHAAGHRFAWKTIAHQYVTLFEDLRIVRRGEAKPS